MPSLEFSTEDIANLASRTLSSSASARATENGSPLSDESRLLLCDRRARVASQSRHPDELSQRVSRGRRGGLANRQFLSSAECVGSTSGNGGSVFRRASARHHQASLRRGGRPDRDQACADASAAVSVPLRACAVNASGVCRPKPTRSCKPSFSARSYNPAWTRPWRGNGRSFLWTRRISF